MGSPRSHPGALNDGRTANPETLVTALLKMTPQSRESPVDGGAWMDGILFHPERSVRQALILALGQYDAGAFPPDVYGPIVAALLDAYRNGTDAGIPGAAEWTLRRWEQGREAVCLV